MEQHILMIVGDSGSGKSDTNNCVLGEERFDVSDLPYACTKDPVSASVQLNGKELICIDTEGFNDGTSITETQIQKLGDFLRKWKPGVSVVAVAIQYSVVRFSQGVKDVIKFVYDAFQTTEILNHFCIIFTHCPNNYDKEKKTRLYNEAAKSYLREISNDNNISDIPMFFVETQRKDEPDMKKEFDRIREFVFSKNAIMTKDFIDASLGETHETEMETKVSQGIRDSGNKKYEKFIDRKRIVTIPNNGSPRKFSEWETIRSYEELIEESNEEWERNIRGGYEYSGDTRYVVYYDRYRKVTHNLRNGKYTYSGWVETNKTRKYDASRQREEQTDSNTTLYDEDSSKWVYKTQYLRRYKIIDFDGTISYTDWKEYKSSTYENKSKPPPQIVTYYHGGGGRNCYIA